ncbi:ATP-binding protein [Silvania hatchlandensis]|uniref:ATP-binding protein n=1 Tax=Silvania hatchlandensis TaxID=2926469 RepID=A0A9J6PZ74_9ENTR|nr:ATP-binding protein [Silvania hatchlandensis]MCU6663131.1 ATP-binding protein [Silvania hatchlandensis]
MYLASCAFEEPEEPLVLYYPSWLNVWESHSYNNALKSTGKTGWGFKRFGTLQESYIRETIRKPDYIPYIEAMEKTADSALHQLSTKERMRLFKSRTAFIYVDSWGESGVFENNISALHASVINTLPKSLVKKFSVTDVTCKVRGEKYALIQAMRLAQDYLNWNVFDFVIICGGYRAIPLLTFTAENINPRRKGKKSGETSGINVSIERVGCFIFSQRESRLKIQCGAYVAPDSADRWLSASLHGADIDLLAYAGGRDIPELSGKTIDLVSIYGSSGCLTPALSWQYITHRELRGGCIRTILADNPGGCSYFDTWY